MNSPEDKPALAPPALAIGIPVYNGEKFIGRVLDCLGEQTFRDFQVVICDNASTDRTGEICRARAKLDPRIRYVRNEKNIGAVPNFCRAFELSAKAPLFKWMASDDLIQPTYLAACIKILDDHPDVILAHSGTAFIDEEGKYFPIDQTSGHYLDPKSGAKSRSDCITTGTSALAVWRFWQVLKHARWGTHMFGVIRRAALERTRLLEPFPSSDRAMLAELALLGRFQAVPERLFLKRFHSCVSWAMPLEDLKSYLDTNGETYSRRGRQMLAYYAAPTGKPINWAQRTACRALLGIHCIKIAGRALVGKMRQESAQSAAWRVKEQ